MEDNFSLGGLRKKIDLSQLKGGLKAEQFDFGKKDKLKSVFDKIDANKDGTISAEEMGKYIDLLEDAAGADKKLNRKEAKAADLGNRRHINKILKQAIELSKNIETPQEPSPLPEATTPDTPIEEPVTDPVTEETDPPIVQEPPLSVDDDGDETVETEPEEFTAADALKNLFGDKRKASVKIDGSATGLGRAYQGEIRLPNGETLEDGAFPENLRMTLPPDYGQNATMKLKLIDPENGIYETSAKDRNFQIVTDENGNVTIQSVNIEELQGKLNANLAEYARIEAERRAAEEAAQAGGAEGAGDVGDGNGVQQLTPEQIAAEKEKQRNAAGVADELYNALKGSHFNAVSGKAFQNSLNKVTSENASAILSQYNTKHPDESLVRMICNEKTSNDDTRKAALNHVMTQLAAEAKAKGVPAEEVDQLVTEFETSADKEFDGWFNVIDATVMDNTMKRLLGLTQGATLNAGEISVADAQESVTVGAEGEYNTAKQSYDTAREEEGWFAKRGDDLLGIFGCTTRADMEAKLGKYKGDIEKLQNCQTEDEFKAAYKEVFGIEYDGKKIAAYQAAYSDYVVAYGAKENADKMQTLFNEARGLNYDAYKTKVMEAMNMSADEVDALVDGMSEEYMAQNPHSDKKDVLRHWVDMQKQNSIQQFDQIAKGRTLEQINQDVDSVRQAAFGTNDIVNDVIKYNSNQELTGMATEIGAEIAVTTALALVPGGQAFAAARIAASAAKWGARGVKLARYMPKAANLVSKASSAVRNSKAVKTATNVTTRAANAVKDSKVARTVTNTANKVKDATPAAVRQKAIRITRAGDAAFEGTLAVNLADGKSVEESLKKALQNAAFGVAGATSAELAPVVAKALGCSSKIATEICEQSLDVASTAGISYGVTGGYTSDDAFVDILTGVAMNRLGKIKGRQGNTEKVKPQQELPVPDEHHIRLSEAPRDVLDIQEGDITFAGAQARNQSTLQRATNNNTSTTGGSFSEQKFEQVKDEVRQELSQPTTAKRAAEIHDEADKHQIQDRDQGREIKHIVEDATGVYDSPTLGKIDLAKETDPAKLAQAKKEISQWFDGKKDVRGDAARDRQELLDKIDARMAELNADPNLQGQKVESKIVEELNANTEKNAAQVLANQGKPLSPHGASILDDQIKLTNTVEDLETMKKQLESRVGYQVQGTDHAAATIKKIDAKIKSVKAHQADFAATTGRIDDAISAGKGLNADDLQTIRAFMEKSNSADELKQIADKMNSSKAIRSYGGSKKLIKDINAKIETLNAKALTSDGVSTGAAANTQQANYVDANQSKMQDAPEAELGDTRTNAPEQSAIETETPVVDPHHMQVEGTPRPVEAEGATIDFETARKSMAPSTPEVTDAPKVETPEVNAKETPVAETSKVETEEVTPESIADYMKSVDDVDIPFKYKELWGSCKTKLKYLTNEVTQSLGNLSKSTLAKCEALIGDLKTISFSVTGKVKAQIDKLIKNFEKLVEKTKVNDNIENVSVASPSNKAKVNDNVEIVSVASPSNKAKVNDNVEIVSVASPSNKAKVNDNVEIVSVASPSNKAKVNDNVENTNPVSNKKIKLDYPEISTKNGTQVLTKGQKYVLDLNKNQDTQFALGFGVANLDVNDKLFLEKFNALKEGESFTVGSWEGNADYKIGSMQLGVSREHFTVLKENGQMVIIDKKSTNGTKMRKNTSEYVSSNEIRQMFKNDRMDYNYLSNYLDKHGFGWKCSYKLDNVDYANMEKLMNVCDGKYVDVWKATTMTDGVPNMQKLATLAKILRKNDAVDDFMKLGPNEWDLIVCTACQKQSNAVEPLMFYKENSNPMNKMLSAGQTSPEIEKLTEFLDKQRINKKVRLYRGEGYNGSLSRAYGSDGQNLGSKMEQLIANGASESKIKQFIDEELLGQEIKQERFMSTTLTPDIAQSWAHGMMGNDSTYGAIRWDISAPAGTKAAFCEDFNIPYGKENEVLVQRNSSLKITNARFDKDTQTWVISARIMQD